MIEIWGKEVPGFNPEYKQPVPTLTPFLVNDSKPAPALVVCPGGAYAFKADHEGSGIARWLNTLGISAFVLDYRVTPYHHPYPLMDARRAIQYVRCEAQRFNIDPNRIGIIGFSAGGHLAASAAIYAVPGDPTASDPVSRVSSRPDCLILGYPVISMQNYHHQYSRDCLLGPAPDPALVDETSLELQVNSQVPPTFIWHTADDDVVPVENALLFASALSKNKVPFALHIFPQGVHGLGVAQHHPEVKAWTTLLTQWLTQRGFLRGESI